MTEYKSADQCKAYLARGSNIGPMLPRLHEHFAMIKQKSENKRM